MYLLKYISFAFLVFFHFYSSVKGADLAKNDTLRLQTTDPTDHLTDNILSRIKYLVATEVKHSPALNTINNHEDRLSSTILCPNTSKCKPLSSRESRTLKTLAFLAGLKFGKHFLQGAQVGAGFQNSGSFAASNSLSLFGKVLNTALSVSYGSPLEGDVIADEPSFMSAVLSDVHVQAGIKTPLIHPQPHPISISPSPVTSVTTPDMKTEVTSEIITEEATSIPIESQPSFKAVLAKSEGDEDVTMTEAEGEVDLGPEPTPLKVAMVELEQATVSSPKTATQEPPHTQVVLNGVRHSQPKTKEQLFFNSRKRFLDEHNERFRKLFGPSVKHNAIVLY